MGEKDDIKSLAKAVDNLAEGLKALAESHKKLATGCGFLAVAQNEHQKIIDTILHTQEDILVMLADFKVRILRLEQKLLEKKFKPTSIQMPESDKRKYIS